MKVCRYFLQGNCRFGDRCRFLHSYGEGDNYDSYDQNYNPKQNYHGNRYEQNYNYNSSPPRYNSNERQNYSQYDDRQESGSYNRNKYNWVSEDYTRKKEIKSASDFSFKTSTPKSKVSFSFKESDHVQQQRNPPSDLYMNSDNMTLAELIKEEANLWELGNQWPLTCFGPFPEKSCFPGFLDISQEELRLEAYRAKENNSFDNYIASVKRLLELIRMRRDELKVPSMELMSIIQRLMNGENLTGEDTVDAGLIFSKSSASGSLLESMESTSNLPPINSSSFFNPPPTSDQVKSSALTFSFKTTNQATDQVKTTAAAFSFKSSTNQSSGDACVYTPMDKLSEEDKEQFKAETFSLGKIPTVPPPREFCI